LQFSQTNTRPKIAIELTLPTETKLVLKNFQRFKKNKKTQHTHDTTMKQKLNTDNGLQGRWTNTTGYNSTYKKLAVQWLNEALCFVSSLVVVDSFRLRNRQLLVAAKRYG
jgi:hypothetical protein